MGRFWSSLPAGEPSAMMQLKRRLVRRIDPANASHCDFVGNLTAGGRVSCLANIFALVMALPEAERPKACLRAAYQSPHNTENFEFAVKTSATPTSVDERTAYLSELRQSVKILQGEINTFLTKKMEEDKVEAHGANVVKQDEKEEENYGEEVVDDNG